ncbi:hypothetical protein, partial [Lacticaseibacillus paracasei]|uniref:hypothetical protein n=1 Tax=Lacticaseibacillus paracasei TaxID=1597 RepID=UPI0021C47456
MRTRKTFFVDSSDDALASDEELKTYMATHQIETLSAAIKSLLDDEHRLNNQLDQANERASNVSVSVQNALVPLEKKINFIDRNLRVLLKLFDGVVVQNGWDNLPIPDDTMKPTTVA